MDYLRRNRRMLGSVLALAAVCLGGWSWCSAETRVEFNRDIRPILSDNCYACHGPDKNNRKADLRLDTKAGLFATIEKRVVVTPGHVEQSELWHRVSSGDPDQVMPRPSYHHPLSARQIALLKRWIEQGATWEGHWAYTKPVAKAVPTVAADAMARNSIDSFILEKLQAAHLAHAPEADRVTLIRRLSFDLTGLPPKPEEVAAFIADQSPDAYEKLVDHLLASPHFGERMAMMWLDLVRYADSVGYHSDNPMPVSPYRDYVIRSFNDDVPFDRFTREQIAGDLLPSATLNNKVASTYNRLLQTTEEGGAQAKEYIAKYDADRVRSVSTVWLGSTMACCQCHDHKFDPFTTKDFYSMAAFFADIQEAAVGSRGAGMPVAGPEQQAHLRALEDAIGKAKADSDAQTPERQAAQLAWEQSIGQGQVNWQTLQPTEAHVEGSSHLKIGADGIIRDEAPLGARENYVLTAPIDQPGITAIRLEAMSDDALPAHGPGVAPNGNFVMTEFKLAAGPANVAFSRATADFSQDQFPVANAIDGKGDTGWAVQPQFGKSHFAIFQPATPLSATAANLLVFRIEFQSIYAQHQLGKFRLSFTTAAEPTRQTMPAEVTAALAVPAASRNDQQKHIITAYFETLSPLYAQAREKVKQAEKARDDFQKSLPSTLATVAGAPRTIRVLPRGNWMSDDGEIVTPAIPTFLGKLNVDSRRATRLDLADWLVSADNPLTARVVVNRLWKMFYGEGLSKDLGDLGAQGEWPTHPELLDSLAVHFATNWDVKKMVRLMVTSGTYRQSSVPTSEQKDRDPFNRLYARQARFRLDAEMVRDNALSVSGLLVDQIGGPSVKPYQPAGYWDALNFPPRTWQPDTGASQYRRGLYTWWQRSFLHPSLLAFDAPSREEGVCERNKSNIPQQALVLLNDPSYVEASRALAERALAAGQMNTAGRVQWMFEQALSRSPRPQESSLLTELFNKQLAQYTADPAAADKLLDDGQNRAAPGTNHPELAAWSNVARVILNLHETITRM